jgi:heat shock protein HslJ
MGQGVSVIGFVILFVILVVSCTAPEKRSTRPAATGIEGPEWQLLEVGGSPVSPTADKSRPFIRFDGTKKQASGFTGCNNFFGSYELDGSSLKFGPLGATRMFCEGVSGEIEIKFMQALEQTRTWELRDDTLFLYRGSKVLARFAKGQRHKPVTSGKP